MKSKASIRKAVETVAGAVLGAVIAGPVGAVAGGLVPGHIDLGVEPARRTRCQTAVASRRGQDPVRHARLKRILVPFDFSDPAKCAVRFAKEWAKSFGAEICLLHVLEPTTALGESGAISIGKGRGDLSGRAKAALERLRRRELAGAVLVTLEVRKGDAPDQIVAAARDLKSDIIIIPTHGRTGLNHALLGSTAERVVRRAPCPVLTSRHA